MSSITPRHCYDTLSQAVNDLIKRGYTTDFLILKDTEGADIKEAQMTLSPDEYIIDEIHRFEGMTDPSDESIIFAISSIKHQLKGLVINSYGADFGYRSSLLVKNL